MIDVWHTLESAFPKIVGAMRATEADLPKHPLEDVQNWRRMMDFALFPDQPINGEIITETLSRRAYMNPIAMDAQFASLVEQGFAEKYDDGTFIATDKGSELYLDYEKARMRAFSEIELLSDENFAQLIAFLQKGYDLAKQADDPKDKPSMAVGYKFYTQLADMGGQLGSLLGWINLFELYRDDVHASIWREAGFTGIRIEVLTHVWHDDEHNAEKLADHLAFRGYTEADYQTALDELVAFGLVTTHDDYYTLTDEGREFRNSLEEDTQAMFQDFCLMNFSEDDLENFTNIIEQLKADNSNQ